MRIAVSGSHRTGKSTLVRELSNLLPGYSVIDEPYHIMEEEGYDFAHPPSLEDFEAQLERSILELDRAGENVIFDRFPIDFLAYIARHEDAGAFDADEWLAKVREAVGRLDLVVFVPIGPHDQTLYPDDDGLRTAVDEELRELLFDDPFALEVDVLDLDVKPQDRVRTVLRETGLNSTEVE